MGYVLHKTYVRGDTMSKQPRLYPAVCQQCNQTVTHTIKGTLVLCPVCHRWTIAGDNPGREKKRQKQEQLTLF